MYVVTGCFRSGTSLCLQTMALLGVPMAAPKFLPEHDNIKEFNPNGFYELNDYDGVKDERHEGKAIKLFGKQLYDTPKWLIKKLIYIERRKEDAIISYDKIRERLPHSDYTSEQIYEANHNFIHNSIDENCLILKLEWVTKYPRLFVLAICTYLEIDPTEKQFNEAVNNVICH